MAGQGISNGRWSLAVSLVVVAAMATIALITVQRAGCADPGHYVARGSGYELIGGCVEPGDLPVMPEQQTPAPEPDHSLPVRP